MEMSRMGQTNVRRRLLFRLDFCGDLDVTRHLCHGLPW